jgi:hypothetical protein
LTLKTGTGGDTVNVGSDPVNLTQSIIDPIQGAVTVNGQGGNSTLNVNDEGTSSGQEYDVFATKITRTPYNPPSPLGRPTQTINYANVGYVNVYGGSGSGSQDVLGVSSTSPQTTRTALYTAGDHNEFVAEGPLGTLDAIQGPLAVHGVGADVFIANDAGNTIGQSYAFTTGQLQRGGMANITYDGVIEFGLYAANNQNFGHTPNTVSVQSLGAVLAGVVVGAGDTVTVGQNGSLASILADFRIQSYLGVPKQVTLDDSADTTARTVTLSSDPTFDYLVSGLLPPSSVGRGRIGLQLDPTTRVSILGGPADDVFQIKNFTDAPAITIVAEPAISTRANMHNKLDYSAYTGTVQVNLPLGMATGFAKVSGIQDVTGSIGNSLLVGDANPNILVGGTGRNVLIGGGGGDTLDGSRSTGDNILIAGTTVYDGTPDYLLDLDAIFAEWTRTDLMKPIDTYHIRFSDLSNGSGSSNPLNVVNGKLILLNNQTVHADPRSDTLIASNGIDPTTFNRVHNWLFDDFSAADVIIGFLSSSDHKTKVP